MKQTKKNKKKNFVTFHNYIIVTLIIMTMLLLGLIWFIGVLPFKYFSIGAGIVSFIVLILIYNLIRNKNKILVSLISIIVIVAMVFGVIYEINTISFLKRLGVSVTKVNYSVITLKSDKYEEINDLEHETIGVFEDDFHQEAIDKLETKLIFENETIEEIASIDPKLTDNEVEGILINTSQLEIIKEFNEDLNNKIEVLYSFDIEVVNEVDNNSVDILKDSFNIYISGMDTYGEIGLQSRSDVNMVVSINPNNHKVLITTIPRDFYVELPQYNYKRDKLTHAGIYGIDSSIATVEHLLDLDINYYVKVNFNSLINIVDAIGPIEVYSDYDFTTGIYDDFGKSYSFKKGMNTMNGKQALAFSRERKSFVAGDRTRNENQERVIEAIIDKALTPKILTNYTNLLAALSDSFITDFSDSDVTNFVKYQLDENPKWQIESLALDGTDGSKETYSYPGYKLYVMIPDLDLVNYVKKEIKEVLK